MASDPDSRKKKEKRRKMKRMKRMRWIYKIKNITRKILPDILDWKTGLLRSSGLVKTKLAGLRTFKK